MNNTKPSMSDKIILYALRLSGGRYYIGKTRFPVIRIKNHFHEKGATWTKIHKPEAVVQIKLDADRYDEDKLTKIYMVKYGIDKVRGGSYCQTVLDYNTMKFLQRELATANDLCFHCGCKGHFINNCPQKDFFPRNGLEE